MNQKKKNEVARLSENFSPEQLRSLYNEAWRKDQRHGLISVAILLPCWIIGCYFLSTLAGAGPVSFGMVAATILTVLPTVVSMALSIRRAVEIDVLWEACRIKIPVCDKCGHLLPAR